MADDSVRLCVCLFGRRRIGARWNQSNVSSTVAPRHAESCSVQRMCKAKTGLVLPSNQHVCFPLHGQRLTPSHCFCFVKIPGSWCVRVMSLWTECLVHFWKVSVCTIFRFIWCFCINGKVIYLIWSTGVEDAGWDISRTLLDWDEWRVVWKTKSNWGVVIVIFFYFFFIL